MNHLSTLLSRRREIRGDAAEPPRPFLCAEAAGGLLLQLHHPQVTLSLIVIKGDREVDEEARHFFFPSPLPPPQVAPLLADLLRQPGCDIKRRTGVRFIYDALTSPESPLFS